MTGATFEFPRAEAAGLVEQCRFAGVDLIVGQLGWELVEGADDRSCLFGGDVTGGEGLSGGREPAGQSTSGGDLGPGGAEAQVIGAAQPRRGPGTGLAFGDAVAVQAADGLRNEGVEGGAGFEDAVEDGQAFSVGEPEPVDRTRTVHRGDRVDHSRERGQDRMVQIRRSGDRHGGNARPDHRQSAETESSTWQRKCVCSRLPNIDLVACPSTPTGGEPASRPLNNR